MKNETILKELVIKEGEVNEKLLLEILKPYIRIEEGTGDLIPTEKFSELSNEKKVIIGFLYSKAKTRLGFSQSEKLKPRELESLLGMKGNTLRPILKRLKDNRVIRVDKEGYWLPNIYLTKAKELLGGEENE